MRFKNDITGESQLILERYISNNFDGTPSYILGVDASGNVIKQASTDFLTSVPTLQQVTAAGNTTTNDVILNGGRIYVKENDLGNDAVVITRDADEGYIYLLKDGVNTIQLRGNSDSYFNGGNVGIGTTSPSYKLQVTRDGTGADASSNYAYVLDNPNPNATAQAVISQGFRINGTFEGMIQGQNGRGLHLGGGLQRDLTIDNNGNVGVNKENSISAKLHIVGGARATNATTLLVENTEGDDIIVVKDGGNVGIGTTSPSAKLHVSAADGDIGQILIKGGNNTVTAIGEINSELLFGSNDTSVNNTVGGKISSVTEQTNGSRTGLAFYTFNQSVSPNLDEHMRLDYLGRFGIGTSSPSAKLEVSGNGVLSILNGSTDAGMRLLASNTGKSYIHFADTDDADRGAIIYDHTFEGFKIRALGQDRHSFGANVGIGTFSTSPSAKLHIVGGAVDGGGTALLVENGAGTDLVTVLDSGSVEIDSAGTNLPLKIKGSGELLQSWVSSTSNSYINLHNTSSTGTGFTTGLTIALAGNDAYFKNRQAGRTILGTNNVDRLELASDGQLKLNTYTSTNFDGTPTAVLGVDGSGNVIKQASTDFLTSVPTLQQVTDAGATTDKGITAASFIINSDGALFDHFHSGTSNTAVEHRFRSNVTGLTNAANILGYVGFAKDTDGGSYFNVRYTDNLGAINTLLRGNSSGNISIGTTGNSAKLHIVGGAVDGGGTAFLVENGDGTDLLKLTDNGTMMYQTDTVIYNGTSNLHLYLKNPGGTGNSLIFWQDSAGGNDWYFGQGTENGGLGIYNYAASSGIISFNTDNSISVVSQLKLLGYTSTNFDGTPSAVLGVDGSGNVIKTTSLTTPTLSEVITQGSTYNGSAVISIVTDDNMTLTSNDMFINATNVLTIDGTVNINSNAFTIDAGSLMTLGTTDAEIDITASATAADTNADINISNTATGTNGKADIVIEAQDKLKLKGGNVMMPTWATDGQRPTATGLTEAGTFGFNVTRNTIEVYNGSAWVQMS